jgi:MFS family permease
MRKMITAIRQQVRKFSSNRKYLWVATVEGVPATIMMTLLGGPFMTGYLLFLGASSGQIGFVFAVTTFVNIVQIWMAYLIQKIRNRKWTFVLYASLHRILWASTGLIPIVLNKEWWVIAFIVLFTTAFLANSAASVVWSTLISDMVLAPVRGRYFGIRNTILNAMGSLSLFLGGLILDKYTGWTGFAILYIVVGTCTVLNIITFLGYPNLPFEKSTESNFLPMLKKPLKDSSFMKAVFFLAGWLLVQTITVPFFSYVMLKILKISYQQVSTITVVQTVVMMMSFYIWGNLNARYSNKQLLFWTLPLIALSCLMWGGLAFWPTLIVLYTAHILLGAGVGGFNQLAFNYLIGDTPKSERPMFIAMFSAITGFAAFLGPLLGGWIYGKLASFPGWVEEYGVSVAVGLILLLGLIVGRVVLRDTKEKETTSVI